MKKRYLSMMLAALICAAGVMGCGGGGDSTETETQSQTEEAAGETSVNAMELEVDTNTEMTSSKDTLTIAMPSDPGTIDMHYSTAYDYVAPFIVNHLLIQEYDENGTVLSGCR